MTDLFERHRARFEAARQACRDRCCWTPFAEMPAQYPDGEAARRAGQARHAARLNQPWRFDDRYPAAPESLLAALAEVSPYTREALGIAYPHAPLDTLFEAARAARGTWAQASPTQRVGVLMEVIDRLYREHLFDVVEAVMHTAGQSANMSYAGSGVNALDRGIEALVYALDAMQAVAPKARWSRRFGPAEIVLDKTYRLVPRGTAVCFTCASFPTWNAWPSMMASLATGNAVIVKPHPATVLPMALSVQAFRTVLAEAGFDPNLVLMALDTVEAPIGKEIVRHPQCAIVDFTGSVAFGQWVEQHAHPALVFTETAGCNTVVLESAADLEAAIRALATTLCMFSAQMCTSPQNFYIPAQGVRDGTTQVPFEEVARRLSGAIEALATDPRKASMILAAVQSERTLAMIDELHAAGAREGRVWLAPGRYVHPAFPQARTCTPLVLEVTPQQRALYGQERFGPVAFLIRCADRDDALQQATRDVHEFGGLTAFLYSEDAGYVARAEDAYAQAGAQLTVNLTGPMPLNFSASYSDYHVTGLNPAGNASLTDLAFVASRFRVVQSRRPAPAAASVTSS